MLLFLYILHPLANFHSTLLAWFSHTTLSPLPFIFLFSLSLFIHPFLSPHFSLLCSLTISHRAYLSVIWRMGLQHRGQGTWCSGCHCYSNLYHDTGSRATHHAEVKLPRDTWQEELKHRPLQGNTEVSWLEWMMCIHGEMCKEIKPFNSECPGLMNQTCNAILCLPCKAAWFLRTYNLHHKRIQAVRCLCGTFIA